MEESLKGDIQMLKNQLISEQTAKEKLEDTFTQELDSLREQLGNFPFKFDSQAKKEKKTGLLDHQMFSYLKFKIVVISDDVY